MTPPNELMEVTRLVLRYFFDCAPGERDCWLELYVAGKSVRDIRILLVDVLTSYRGNEIWDEVIAALRDGSCDLLIALWFEERLEVLSC